MRIAISSKSGCGNTTVTNLVAGKLGYPVINFTFRQLAEERGVEFWDFCKMAETDYNIDRELDRRQTEMAMAETNCVLASRLAIWMLEKADLKVYLTASAEVRASRILKREGGDLETKMNETNGRDVKDHNRYLKIYGIDNDEYAFADLVIATDNRTPEEIAEMIVEEAKKRGA
jgi:cytidylate kinase, putative